MARTTDDDRKILGSGHPATQEEARQDAIERAGGEEQYLKDPESYWTAQQGDMPRTGTAAALEPVHYLPEQLPDPEAARAAGITPQNVDSLIVDEDAASHPNGPEPGEVDVINARREYGVGAEALEPDIDLEAPTAMETYVENQGAEVEEDEEGVMTKAQLLERAKELGMSGYSGLNKAELADAVAEAEQGQGQE